MPLIRRERAEEKSGSFQACLDGPTYKKFAELGAFLSTSKWEDGSARATGTAMLMVEDGLWKCWLHDRDAFCGLFVAGETLDQVLAAADKAAGGAGGGWRPDRAKAKK